MVNPLAASALELALSLVHWVWVCPGNKATLNVKDWACRWHSIISFCSGDDFKTVGGFRTPPSKATLLHLCCTHSFGTRRSPESLKNWKKGFPAFVLQVTVHSHTQTPPSHKEDDLKMIWCNFLVVLSQQSRFWINTDYMLACNRFISLNACPLPKANSLVREQIVCLVKLSDLILDGVA